MKEKLTRRQWTVLLEASLRMGLGMHVMWLCRLNNMVWEKVLTIFKDNQAIKAEDIDRECWNGHETYNPLLEMGRDATPSIRKKVQGYFRARVGFNVVLHALEDTGQPWCQKLGVPSGEEEDSVAAIASFLFHLDTHANDVRRILRDTLGHDDLETAVNVLVDSKPSVLAAQSSFTKNLFEFIRHSLGQLQPKNEEMKSYDQAYLLFRKTRGGRSPYLVQPGPASLIFFAHACCKSLDIIPASMDDFRDYLAEYGLHVPSGELQKGQIGKDMEKLGLVVDSPDAGGGRLIVDPF